MKKYNRALNRTVRALAELRAGKPVLAATQETARMSNTVLGACPICGVEMPVVEVGRVQAYVGTER
jgi:hypothetical protein